MAGNLSVIMNIQSSSLKICKNQLSVKSFCFVLLLVASRSNTSNRYFEALVLNIPGEVERENCILILIPAGM